MIVLDTHILIWWLTGDARLKPSQLLEIQQSGTLAVSAISLWEIAKLVENHRLSFNMPVLDWINAALTHPKIQVIPLLPEIVVCSTQLPGGFHKDPADQLIVATAITLDVPLLTMDRKILAYPHVKLASVP